MLKRRKKTAGILGLVMAAVFLCSGCQTSVVNKDAQEKTTVPGDGEVTKGISEQGIPIVFSEDGITTSAASGVTIEDNVVTITAAGSYELTGSSSDSRVVVTVDKEAEVELILNGLDLTCSSYAPIVVTQAGEVTIDLAEESVNRITDGAEYELTDSEDTTDAAIFSRDDLKLKGDGTLYIYANYNHGIVAKDDLTIKGGAYIIEAVTDGINANDSITIDGGTFQIIAGDDGMHVDEEFTINDGTVVIAESYEGIEGHQVIINGGIIDITSSDDGINSNSGGSETESASEGAGELPEGMELPEGLEVPEGAGELPEGMEPPEGAGELPEGMEPPEGAGELPEGMEAPKGAGELPEGMEAPEGAGDFPEGMDLSEDLNGDIRGNGGREFFGGGMGEGMMMDTDADSLIQINGGVITVNAGGDGLDSNGTLEINGGEVYVSGAANHGDSAVDYGLQAYMNGGVLIATGYSNMAEPFSSESEQCSFLYTSAELLAAGTALSLQDERGTELVSWEVQKECNNIIISVPELTVGEGYALIMGNDSFELEITDVVNSFAE